MLKKIIVVFNDMKIARMMMGKLSSEIVGFPENASKDDHILLVTVKGSTQDPDSHCCLGCRTLTSLQSGCTITTRELVSSKDIEALLHELKKIIKEL
jgi:hypothetical protein